MILLLALLPPLYATDHNAATCSQANVASAISASSAGDRVLVPAGTCSWSGNISFSGIQVIGAGSDPSTGTIITTGAATLTKHASEYTRISGFRFTGTARHVSIGGTASNKMAIIDHCYLFTNGGDGSSTMLGITVNGVLVHNNQFVATTATSADVFNILTSEDWSAAQTMGTADTTGERNIYFEDNTFLNILETAPDGDEGGRYVFRHNTWTDSSLVFHSGGPVNDTSQAGHRHFEIYDNTFVRVSNSVAVNKWVWARGGTGVIANNAMDRADSPDGFSFPNKPEIELGIGCESGSYPIPFQIGQVTNTENPPSHPMLIFGNTGAGTGDANFISVGGNNTGPSGHTCSTPGTFVQVNRDYYLSNQWGWTPYTYPHPLQSLGEGSPVSPRRISGATRIFGRIQ